MRWRAKRRPWKEHCTLRVLNEKVGVFRGPRARARLAGSALSLSARKSFSDAVGLSFLRRLAAVGTVSRTEPFGQSIPEASTPLISDEVHDDKRPPLGPVRHCPGQIGASTMLVRPVPPAMNRCALASLLSAKLLFGIEMLSTSHTRSASRIAIGPPRPASPATGRDHIPIAVTGVVQKTSAGREPSCLRR